jgi:hypothetical protein
MLHWRVGAAEKKCFTYQQKEHSMRALVIDGSFAFFSLLSRFNFA